MVKALIFHLETNCLDEFYDDIPTSALVEITKKDVERIAQLRQAVKDLGVYKIDEFDYSPIWCKQIAVGDLSENDNEEDSSDIIILNEKPEIADDEPARMECDILEVTSSGFKWHAYIKHTNVLVNTIDIGFEDIGLPKSLEE